MNLKDAIKNNDLEEVKNFINKTDLNSWNWENGDTALIIAVRYNNIEAIKLLLQKSNPDLQNQLGNTALMLAVINNNIEAIKLLLQKSNPNLQCNYGDTALMLSVYMNYIEIVKLLLPISNIKLNNKDGYTALNMVSLYGENFKNEEITKILKAPDIINLKLSKPLKSYFLEHCDYTELQSIALSLCQKEEDLNNYLHLF